MRQRNVGFSRTPGRFICSPCHDEALLEDILHFHDRFLARASEVTDEEALARFRRCPTAFYGILEVLGGSTLLRGYFVILPLTNACATAIRQGEVTAGKQIRPSHLAEDSQAIEAAYLSVVCAIGARARGVLISSALDTVRNLYRLRGMRFLFARAATGAGARMLTRLTGERFAPDGVIHQIDVSRYPTVTSD